MMMIMTMVLHHGTALMSWSSVVHWNSASIWSRVRFGKVFGSVFFFRDFSLSWMARCVSAEVGPVLAWCLSWSDLVVLSLALVMVSCGSQSCSWPSGVLRVVSSCFPGSFLWPFILWWGLIGLSPIMVLEFTLGWLLTWLFLVVWFWTSIQDAIRNISS